MLLLGAFTALRADLPEPITLDVPIPVNRALPAWLGQPVAPPSDFATLDLPILTPDPAASLLVTVYFQEKQGGFLRVTWQGTQGSQTLSDNFYEDIAMPNQRSLLVSPATLVGDGTLRFQSSESSLGIQRIKLEWLGSKNSLVSSLVQDLLVTPSSGVTQPALSFNGLPATTTQGAWQNLIVTVPMTDAPERIEQGVDFSLDLDEVPSTARIALQETGLPLGQHLVVWINEERAGTITPSVPDLLDTGYLADSNSSANYIGWRPASFYAPVSLLKSGVNTVQFSAEDDLPSTSSNTTPDADAPTPLAIKSFVVQLNYTPTPASLVALFPPASTAAPVETPAPETTAPEPAAPVPVASDDALPTFLSPTGPDLRPVSPSTPDTTTTP